MLIVIAVSGGIWVPSNFSESECVSHSVVSDSVTPRTAARQDPLSMGFSRQENWSRLPCPPPGDLPDPGIEPSSPILQADSLPSEPLYMYCFPKFWQGCIILWKDFLKCVSFEYQQILKTNKAKSESRHNKNAAGQGLGKGVLLFLPAAWVSS